VGDSSTDVPGEAALVERFWDRIRVFARRRLSTASEAEDVAQETMRRVLEALRQGRLRAPEALPAFVFQTARNICLHRHRSVRRQGQAFERLRRWLTLVEPTPDPLADILADGRRGQVQSALTRLDGGDRDLLRMSYFQALDTAEVARRLQVTPGAVRVRRYRALRRLRAILESDAGEKATPAVMMPRDGRTRAE
jgi:RNA polymerase sigma-70 factor (ECF subfamily)